MTSSASHVYDKSRWFRDTLKEAQQHLKACLEGHERCRSHSPATKLPTRIIDVGSTDGSKDPFLVFSNEREDVEHLVLAGNELHPNSDVHQASFLESSTSPRHNEAVKYTTLSYCWGPTQKFILKTENLERLKEKIPWNELPLTIQDAITMTRALNIPYIWVDALCIIQDSPDDWEAESTKMAEIYGGSFLTISAALGPNVHCGLMRSGLMQTESYKSRRNPRTVEERFPLQKDPLYSRAWALQERVSLPISVFLMS